MTTEFFEEQREQSEVKTRLVTKYFDAWSRIILPSVQTVPRRIAYIDLYAGPGTYADGTESTPLRILRTALSNSDLRDALVCILNDRQYSSELERAVAALPGITGLRYPPRVYGMSVDDSVAEALEAHRLIPTLLFADPWGYKGLSRRLFQAVVGPNWGCDCIFFFNYQRVNAALDHHDETILGHMDALFGHDRVQRFRAVSSTLAPFERERAVVAEMAAALQEIGCRHVLTFAFRSSDRQRTSHHIIFVSKHQRGYQVMKDIMAKESSLHVDGVPTYQYSAHDLVAPKLLHPERPLDELRDRIMLAYAGQTVSVAGLFEGDNVGTPYVIRNYKDVLIALEACGAITCEPASPPRRKHTMAGTVMITFPQR